MVKTAPFINGLGSFHQPTEEGRMSAAKVVTHPRAVNQAFTSVGNRRDKYRITGRPINDKHSR